MTCDPRVLTSAWSASARVKVSRYNGLSQAAAAPGGQSGPPRVAQLFTCLPNAHSFVLLSRRATITQRVAIIELHRRIEGVALVHPSRPSSLLRNVGGDSS